MRKVDHLLRWGLAAAILVAAAPAALAGGLPQLNPAVFSPQLIWLSISFVILYILMSRVALPDISRTLTARQEKLDGDLSAAEGLRAEAEAANSAYKKAIADARTGAQAQMKAVAEAALSEAAKREAAFAAEVNTRTKAAEQAIATAKQKAMGDIQALAGEAARQLVARLSGVEPSTADVSQALAAAGREKA
jgi:F-type H+-transporting ATPase subunit b